MNSRENNEQRHLWKGEEASELDDAEAERYRLCRGVWCKEADITETRRDGDFDGI